jgi:hypothetical protein
MLPALVPIAETERPPPVRSARLRVLPPPAPPPRRPEPALSLTLGEAVAILRQRLARREETTRREQTTSGYQTSFPTWWLGPLSRRLYLPAAAAPESAPTSATLVGRRRSARGCHRRHRQLCFWFFRRERACSTLPRARTVVAKRLTAQERAEAARLRLFAKGWDRDRPKTRGDCAKSPRPCPYVGCSKNLYLDVNGRSIKFNFPGREPGDMPPTGSCALDVADRVAQGEPICLADIGGMTNRSIERIRQISALALQNARVQMMWQAQLTKVRLPVKPPEPGKGAP